MGYRKGEGKGGEKEKEKEYTDICDLRRHLGLAYFPSGWASHQGPLHHPQ